MSKPIIYIFLFDSYADWEIAYVGPGIHQTGLFTIQTVGVSTNPVLSSGNLRVIPDISLDEIRTENAALLILPGGTAWENGENQEIFPIVKQFHAKEIPIAAICAGTTALGAVGLLEDKAHTSNSQDYLKAMCPSYKGDALYENKPAVTGNGIITANGTASLEFAYAIFKLLNVYSDEELEYWYQLFKHGVMASSH